MADILDRIAAYKRREIAASKSIFSQRQLAVQAAKNPPPRGFRASLESARATAGWALIAEFKRASPSKGFIHPGADPETIARAYADGGAAALSVLTDTPSFCGSFVDLARIRAAVPLPLLRKDFIIDPYQITEARLWGADCILLIMALVDDIVARTLLTAAADWQLDCLVEVHNRAELERAHSLGATLIGINNRDLKTFVVDLAVTEDLAPLIAADCFIIAESGLSSGDDLARLQRAGAHGFLIGEALMRSGDIAAATSMLAHPNTTTMARVL